MHKTNNYIALVVLILILGACKTVKTSSGDKLIPFHGTIVYDVEVTHNADERYEKNRQYLYGNEMSLTIFKNGDIQRTYTGSDPDSYDIQYIDLEKNVVLKKYNKSDSLFYHQASTQNVFKINDLRTSKEELKVLNYELKDVSIGAEKIVAADKSRKYLTLKYWYSDQLKIDKSKYTNVNDDLWNYFMNKSDGSLYLKYEVDYFTYKVIYTAKEILANKYEKSKQKLKEDIPRVKE